MVVSFAVNFYSSRAECFEDQKKKVLIYGIARLFKIWGGLRTWYRYVSSSSFFSPNTEASQESIEK